MRRAITPPTAAELSDPVPEVDMAPDGARICDAVAGPRLCDVRVWSEAEWSALAEADRPREHAYFPGLGWVGVVPVVGLN